jgi:hypothetical protein
VCETLVEMRVQESAVNLNIDDVGREAYNENK